MDFFLYFNNSQAIIIVCGGKIGVLISSGWNYSTDKILFIAFRKQVNLIQNIFTFSIYFIMDDQ